MNQPCDPKVPKAALAFAYALLSGSKVENPFEVQKREAVARGEALQRFENDTVENHNADKSYAW